MKEVTCKENKILKKHLKKNQFQFLGNILNRFQITTYNNRYKSKEIIKIKEFKKKKTVCDHLVEIF